MAWESHSQETDFVQAFPHVRSLIIVPRPEDRKVRLGRRITQDDPKAASPLKVLWYRSGRRLPEVDMVRFQNLVSFETADNLSPSQWRRFLQGPSTTLKHLRVEGGLKGNFLQGTITTLELPNLMVLDLDGIYVEFPQWLVVREAFDSLGLFQSPASIGIMVMGSEPHGRRAD